jgi:uncharacterized membrane protein
MILYMYTYTHTHLDDFVYIYVYYMYVCVEFPNPYSGVFVYILLYRLFLRVLQRGIWVYINILKLC